MLPSHLIAQTPKGDIQNGPLTHTPASRLAVISGAQTGLPASLTRAAMYVGPLQKASPAPGPPVPVVVFMHGSSGLGLQAIAEWQHWLAGMGIASLAPDSFGLQDKLTYHSPIDKDTYEQVHALRASEILLALAAIRQLPWADSSRLVLAGSSEGAVSVARYTGKYFAGRIMFGWSCEDNYFVSAHKTAIADDQPALNIISTQDPYFSPANSWLGNSQAVGHAGTAFRNNPQARVVLIPGSQHTVFNLPQAKVPVEAFLKDLFKL